MLNYQLAPSALGQSTVQSIDANFKFIEELTLQYTHQTSLPKAQLMMICRKALVRAIEHFDVDRGLTFNAHATWWVKQSIEREIMVKQIGSHHTSF